MASPLELTERLRRETATRHVRLERGLGLTPRTVTRDNVARLLLRFHRFFCAWEPWMEASPVDSAFFGPRRKLPLIERDLAAMGLLAPDHAGADPIRLGEPSLARAFGSLYVVEGSTLGGQVINRWLDGSEWLPDGGIAYFASYGRDVGRMWRGFRSMIGETVPASRHDEVVEGAVMTFDELHSCLCGKEEMA